MSIVSLSSEKFLLSGEILVDKSALLNPEFGAFVDRYGSVLKEHYKVIMLLPVTKVKLMTSFRNGYDWLNARKALATIAKNWNLFSNSSFNFNWEALIGADELGEILNYVFVNRSVQKPLILITSDSQMARDINLLRSMKLWDRTIIICRFKPGGTLQPIFPQAWNVSELWADGEKII